MTTLQNSYTVPMTLEEWVQCVPWLKDDPLADEIDKCAFVAFYSFGEYTVATKPNDGMVRVSVPRFLDLMNDRITSWRLEDFGFDPHPQGLPRFAHKIKNVGSLVIVFHDGNPYPSIYIMSSVETISFCGITTFTELLTLIRMLTPPSK